MHMIASAIIAIILATILLVALWAWWSYVTTEHFNQTVMIRSAHPQKQHLCLDDGGHQHEGDGRKLKLWNCDTNNPNQKFIWDWGSNRIRSATKHNKCIDDNGAWRPASAKAHMWGCDRPGTRENQGFWYDRGSKTLRSVTKGNMCMDDGGAWRAGERDAQLFTCQQGNPNQAWNMIPTSGGGGGAVFSGAATNISNTMNNNNNGGGNRRDFRRIPNGHSGDCWTTRYYDCCKPSCAWSGKSVLCNFCDRSGTKRIRGDHVKNSCNEGGDGYNCLDNICWAISDDLAFGYAAVTYDHPRFRCGQCYMLEFTDDRLRGKRMVVQINNHGKDVKQDQFDLSIPGGGEGIFHGCSTKQFPSNMGYNNEHHPIWGKTHGGVTYDQRHRCDGLPQQLRDGCRFFWDWLKGADNPRARYYQVECPPEISAKSGCKYDQVW